MTSPVVLVLDDVHLLANSECRAALSVLADHVPAGSRLVLAGRAEPPLRIGRLRAEGKILEVAAADLSLTQAEASSLLRAAEVALADDEVAELHRRTEGWAAGLYLAALYLREGGSLGGAVASFGGDDRFVSEYVESELLARIPQSQRVFLTRTAVLGRMCGPLCEAVLDLPGSGAMLAELARSNLLLVPLDRRGQWYRYHHLFRDMLLAELERTEPGLIPVLRRRAARWYLRSDLPSRRWSTSWPQRTSVRLPVWWRNSGCLLTGKAGSRPSCDGCGGWRTGAASRDTRWPRCWPRCFPR
jgi:LuxR family maltose regulon positive regulatory protein